MDETLVMVKVLVVDDSITTCRFLADLVEAMPGLLVCGKAYDGIDAVRLARERQPDVISMDVVMPRMNGLEATRQIMAVAPTPIVVVSAGIGKKEVNIALEALEAGALAAIEKPSAAPHDEPRRREFLRTLHMMAGVSVVRRHVTTTATTPPIHPDRQALPEIVVIGASAGGPGTIVQILSELEPGFSLPILVVQHLAADFVAGFAHWLAQRTALPVQVAPMGQMPVSGEIWVAPGGYHMTLSSDRQVVLHSNKGRHRHQPSIDVLFQSVAEVYGQRAIGVLLTGMGVDGADGMALLHANGASTIVQDEATSVVFGMPAAAIARQAVQYILPVNKIAAALTSLAG